MSASSAEHPLQMDAPLKKKFQHGKKNHKKHQQNHPKAAQPTMTSAEDVVSDAESVDEEEEEEDSDDDSDEGDALVPSSPLKKSSRRYQSEDHEIWAGIELGLEDPDEVPNYGSDAEAEGDDEAELEAAAEDDDYDELDNVSVTTDDSKKFEAEVENEIQQLGEDGIDWDDENTYQYNRAFPAGVYEFDVDLDTPDSVFAMEIFQSMHDGDTTMTDVPENTQHSDVVLSQVGFGTSWPEASDSEEEEDDARSEKTDVPERRISHVSESTELSTLTDTGYETDEEDIPEPVVSSPAIKLHKTPQRGALTTVDRRINESTPRRRNLKPTIMTNIPIRQKKAIAFTVRGPFGSVVHFKTPKGSKLKWVQLKNRRESESSSDSPASPTMVNLDNALLEGNTRTGAHISDAINGRLFQQYHCSQLQLPEPMELEETTLAEFARNPLLVGSIRSWFENSLADQMAGGGDEFDIQDHDEEIHAFIDFDGGFTDDASTPHPTPVSRTASFAGFPDDDAEPVRGRAVTVLDDDDEQIEAPLSSPLKRRMSKTMESTSPVMKRKRV